MVHKKMVHTNQNRWGDARFIHFRYPVQAKGDDWVSSTDEIAGKGGVTIAYVAGEAGVTYAEAFCSPRDNFNGHIGRTISTNRLAAGLGDTFIGTTAEFVQAMESEYSHLIRVRKS